LRDLAEFDDFSSRPHAGLRSAIAMRPGIFGPYVFQFALGAATKLRPTRGLGMRAANLAMTTLSRPVPRNVSSLMFSAASAFVAMQAAVCCKKSMIVPYR